MFRRLADSGEFQQRIRNNENSSFITENFNSWKSCAKGIWAERENECGSLISRYLDISKLFTSGLFSCGIEVNLYMFVGFSLDFVNIQSKIIQTGKQHFTNHLNHGQLFFLLLQYPSRAQVQAAFIFLDLFNNLYLS